jgi:Rod binding domain-containing protein
MSITIQSESPMVTAALSARSASAPATSFARALEDAEHGEDTEATVREAATKLVSSALVMPILASLREGSLREGPFAPGMAERRFGPLLDQHIADRVVSGSSFPLVDAIVAKFQPSIDAAAPSRGEALHA